MDSVDRLLDVMARLRDPQRGCEWDVRQTFETIAPYTIEEAYEVDDAIRRGDVEGLRDELGDLLLQVVFHARIAEEAGQFDFASVVSGLVEKLVRRHPHVFGDVRHATAAERSRHWEDLKAAERTERAAREGGGEADPFDGVPRAAPALARATKLRRRAARAGWAEDEGALAERLSDASTKALSAIERQEGAAAAVGALLDVCAGLAHAAGVDPELALRDANAAFETRARRALVGSS